MIRVIRADIRRILKKVMFYIICLISYLIMFTIKKADTAIDHIELIKIAMVLIGSALFPIAVFIFVYGDEFKAGVIHSIIGRGMSRAKIVTAKYIDCLILQLICTIPLLLIAFIKNAISGLPISPQQNVDLFWSFIIMYLESAGCLAFGTMALFLTMSVAGGMVTLITFIMVVSDALRMIQDYIPLRVYDFYYEGLVEKAKADILVGSVPWQLIPAIAVYIVGVLILTGVLFDRKELDL